MQSISLQETNQLRAKLGLKPLVDDDRAKQPSEPSTSKAEGEVAPEPPRDKDAQAEENYRRKRDEDKRTREAQDSRSRLEKLRNRRAMGQRLEGPTLGQDDSASPASAGSDEASTKKWLKQQRKRAKLNAERLAKEREEAEAESVKALKRTYGEKDVAGLRVAHGWDELRSRLGGEGEGVTLTLKDSNVLDEGDDELVESSLAQEEKDKIRTERAKDARKYTGLDDDEFGDDLLPAAPESKHGVLNKYDGDLDREGMVMDTDEGPKGFVLGSTAVTDRAEERRKQHEQAAAAKNRTLVDLSYDKNHMASDYLQPGEPGFKIKKPKKKRKATQVRVDDLDDSAPAAQPEDAMDLDQAVLPARAPIAQDDNVVDDDELAVALARTRRHKAKRVLNKITPETISKNLAAQKKAEEEEAMVGGVASVAPPGLGGVEPKAEEDDGVTFDATSEFVRHLRSRQAEQEQEQAENEARRQRLARTKSEERSVASGSATPAAGTAPSAEPEQQDVEMADLKRELAQQQQQQDTANQPPTTTGPPDPVAEPEKEEPLVRSGLAATLSLLRNTNALESITPEQLEKEREQRKQDYWLTRRKLEAREKEEERRQSKNMGNRKDQATRERENKEREAMLGELALEEFKDYNPQVEIKYHDSDGRELNVKEAWKDLSHKFHGTAPGYKAQERAMRKRELRLQEERMAAGDTPSGLASAFNMRAQRTGQAHMVLSVGNRGNAPQDWGLGAGSPEAGPSRPSGTTSTSNDGTASRVSKGKASASPASPALPVLGEEDSGRKRRKLPAGNASTVSGPGNGTTSSGTTSMVPRAAFKPGFAPVRSSASPAPPPPSNGNGSSGVRLSLGKRKAPGSDYEQ